MRYLLISCLVLAASSALAAGQKRVAATVTEKLAGRSLKARKEVIAAEEKAWLEDAQAAQADAMLSHAAEVDSGETLMWGPFLGDPVEEWVEVAAATSGGHS